MTLMMTSALFKMEEIVVQGATNFAHSVEAFCTLQT